MIGVEPARASDAAEMAAVHALAFDDPWPAADIAVLTDSPGVIALAVRDAGRVGAFILCRVAADEAEVLTLATVPGLRRRGLAATLLETGLAAALAAGATSMFLEVAADNAPALGLYRRLGFVQAGRRPRYYRRPDGDQDALLMRRDLNR